MNNELCKEHSGFKARIAKLEDNVSQLWRKWDNMQKMVFVIFGGIIINLVGVILLLLRTK